MKLKKLTLVSRNYKISLFYFKPFSEAPFTKIIFAKFTAREGVIIECPLKWQFHDACDAIIASQMAIREMVDHDHVTITITNPSKKPFLIDIFWKNHDCYQNVMIFHTDKYFSNIVASFCCLLTKFCQEKMLKCQKDLKKWFRTAKGLWSTYLLVKITYMRELNGFSM